MGTVMPTAITMRAWVPYWVVTSSQVFSPTNGQEDRSAHDHPVIMTACICQKYRPDSER